MLNGNNITDIFCIIFIMYLFIYIAKRTKWQTLICKTLHLFCHKVSFLTQASLLISRYRSRYEGNLVVLCGSRYSSSKRWILSSNSQNFELFSERKSSIPWSVKLKNWVSFSLFFLRSPLHWIWLIWLKEEGEEKRNTFGTHRNVYCLLKTHLPIITNMFLITNSIIFLISVPENFLVESESFYFTT